jgi:hypothetical protein
MTRRCATHFLPWAAALVEGFAGPNVGDKGLRNRVTEAESEAAADAIGDSLDPQAEDCENTSASSRPME